MGDGGHPVDIPRQAENLLLDGLPTFLVDVGLAAAHSPQLDRGARLTHRFADRVTVAALILIAAIATTHHLKGLVLGHVEHGGVGRDVVQTYRRVVMVLVMALAGGGGREDLGARADLLMVV